MRPIVGRVAGLIPANFGPRAIMHFLLAARRKIVQELHDRRRRLSRRRQPGTTVPLRDVIMVHAWEARSRAWYWGRGSSALADKMPVSRQSRAAGRCRGRDQPRMTARHLGIGHIRRSARPVLGKAQ